MKFQNSDLQNEKHKNLLHNSTERKLTPEEGHKLCQEAEEAGRSFRQYMRQRRKTEMELKRKD